MYPVKVLKNTCKVERWRFNSHFKWKIATPIFPYEQSHLNIICNWETIKKNKTANFYNVPNSIGVYFLFSNDEVVYIGQAGSIRQRIQQHKSDKFFDTVSFIQGFEAYNLEPELITCFHPKYNKRYYGIRCGIKPPK